MSCIIFDVQTYENQMENPPQHILLAVLDWGLGHAGRCVPLIERLQREGHRLTVASSGGAMQLLEATVTGVDWLHLPSYGIRYPTQNMVWNMAVQSPRIVRVVASEHRAVRQFVAAHRPDLIVSDGRFGCYHAGVPSVWMAHQLQIQHPWLWVRGIANAGYHAYIRQHFGEVWVPDWSGDNSLSGQLSVPIAGLPHRHLGALSRFAGAVPPALAAAERFVKVALLSGPEPQRSYLEAAILARWAALPERTLVIRGVPGSSHITHRQGRVHTVDWLLGDALHQYVAAADLLVCRSGYSTLMDLHFWRKPALLVPTPGQTEQTYLADYWIAKGWAQRGDF